MTQGTKTVGVVLSGCGFLDGSEIHEATLTLLALDRLGARALIMAPDVDQLHVVDHAKKRPAEGERRNVLAEAARIARGAISPLEAARAEELDAAIFPGGFGAAKNLSSFATEGAQMTVRPEVEAFLQAMRRLSRPMGFICIAPVLAAKVFGAERPLLTIGDDAGTAAALEAMGARHAARAVDDVAIDPALKLVSTPAYMCETSIAHVARGIDKLVATVLELTR